MRGATCRPGTAGAGDRRSEAASQARGRRRPRWTPPSAPALPRCARPQRLRAGARKQRAPAQPTALQQARTGPRRRAADARRRPARAAAATEPPAATLAAEVQALAEVLAVKDGELWPPMVDQLVVPDGLEAALGAALGEELDSAADTSCRPALARAAAARSGARPARRA